MQFPDWLRFKSPLQAALRRGTAEGGNLVKELDELRDYKIKSRADAIAICDALDLLLDGKIPQGKGYTSPFGALTRLFQEIESAECEACEILRENGIPRLVELVRKQLDLPEKESKNDVLLALKIFAIYGSDEGCDLIIELARKPFAPEDYMWSVVLGTFVPDHPTALRVYGELSDPLPPKFLGISLLDSANRYLIDGGQMKHPFDSDQGISRLEALLKDPDEEHFSYAVSATAAIPFLNNHGRHRLITLAMQHSDGSVAVEAAWAAAKMADERGIEALAKFCLDIHRSGMAQRYLEELKRTDAIPAAAKDPTFRARAEFAEWLAHPNELGRAPDKVEIYDHRELRWPPAFESKPVWLIRYRAKATSELDEDDEGVGMVGSITFCFFSADLAQRPPEDGYAIHCCWELEPELLKTEAVEEGSTEYDLMLRRWSGPPLADPKIVHVAEVAPELKRQERLLAVAAALLNGAPGWVVLDGTQSRWYPAEDQPRETDAQTILKIHLGRSLLNLPDCVDRKRWIKPESKRPPQDYAATYERLLAKLESLSLDDTRVKNLYDELNREFDFYIEALGEIPGSAQPDLIALYERFLAAARKFSPVIGNDAFDSISSVVLSQFKPYADLLIAAHRQGDLIELIEFFAPCWQHNSGYCLLGEAAFKVGAFDRAEEFLVKLQTEYDCWHTSEYPDYLAEIWCKKGRRDDARTMLLQSLKELVQQSCDGELEDETIKSFQDRRCLFLKLFPDPEAELKKAGIPETIKSQ